MANRIIDSKTIMDFSKNIKIHGDKLNDILENMKKATVAYNDMVDTKAGNLYKETMINELTKEQKKLMNRCNIISNEFSEYANLFRDANTTISESVGKNNGNVL